MYWMYLHNNLSIEMYNHSCPWFALYSTSASHTWVSKNFCRFYNYYECRKTFYKGNFVLIGISWNELHGTLRLKRFWFLKLKLLSFIILQDYSSISQQNLTKSTNLQLNDEIMIFLVNSNVSTSGTVQNIVYIQYVCIQYVCIQ